MAHMCFKCKELDSSRENFASAKMKKQKLVGMSIDRENFGEKKIASGAVPVDSRGVASREIEQSDSDTATLANQKQMGADSNCSNLPGGISQSRNHWGLLGVSSPAGRDEGSFSCYDLVSIHHVKDLKLFENVAKEKGNPSRNTKRLGLESESMSFDMSEQPVELDSSAAMHQQQQEPCVPVCAHGDGAGNAEGDDHSSAVPTKKRTPQRSIFSHFFAFDDSFPSFSSVFWGASNLEFPLWKAGSRNVDDGNTLPKENNVRKSPAFALPCNELPHLNAASCEQKKEDELRKSIQVESGDLCLCGREDLCQHCAHADFNVSTLRNLRRHSVDNAQLSYLGNQMDSGHCTPLLSKPAKGVINVRSSFHKDDEWQDRSDCDLDQHLLHQFHECRALVENPYGGVHLSSTCAVGVDSDTDKRANRSSRLGLLSSKLAEAMGLKKLSTVETSGRQRPKKSKSCDSLSKYCSKWRDLKTSNRDTSCCGVGCIVPFRETHSLEIKELPSHVHPREVPDISIMSAGGNGNMVCLDLPLTNFGFYSGEMTILM
ncbi:hypothetical protein PoB_007464400 [Plakobranchus ocellatus]|uniref:Uncharacterized protein n=1 Tax=Plakobranchus ocellatus TaxID=259542 RepID=A0AAV4DVG6_9GAST|nr:hypothetical protein PoB_007464400 [Plakobranchus ocellatus]